MSLDGGREESLLFSVAYAWDDRVDRLVGRDLERHYLDHAAGREVPNLAPLCLPAVESRRAGPKGSPDLVAIW